MMCDILFNKEELKAFINTKEIKNEIKKRDFSIPETHR